MCFKQGATEQCCIFKVLCTTHLSLQSSVNEAKLIIGILVCRLPPHPTHACNCKLIVEILRRRFDKTDSGLRSDQ